MTRGEAIKWYDEEIYLLESAITLNGINGSSMKDAWNRQAEIHRMAIAALREQDVTDINVGNKTNADHIRSMTDEELAAHNVQDSLEYTVDYDWDERPIGEYTPCFKTSDGSTFWSYEDAVEYELHWLKQPYGGE